MNDNLINDPYLNTAKMTLEDRKYRHQYKRKRKKVKSFLKKKVSVAEYFNISDGMANFLVLLSFTTIPYIVGVTFIFIVIARGDIDSFRGIDIDEYTLLWAIGYEVLASIILILIVKSAIRFHKRIYSIRE